MGNKRKIRAQSISEYSLFVAIVLVALITMNVYVKRGLQGRYADIADLPAKAAVSKVKAAKNAGSIPGGYTASAQYEPYYAENNSSVEIPEKQISEKAVKGGKVTRSILSGKPTVVGTTTIEGIDANKDW